MGFLKDQYEKGNSNMMLHQNHNTSISKKMNYYIHNDLWYIRVRKDKNMEFINGDFVIINICLKKHNITKISFALETIENNVAPIDICQMHETRLNTKVNITYNL